MVLVDTTDVPLSYASVYVQFAEDDEIPPGPPPGEPVGAGGSSLILCSERSGHRPRIVVATGEPDGPVPPPWTGVAPALDRVMPLTGPDVRVLDPDYIEVVDAPSPGAGEWRARVYRIGQDALHELDDAETDSAVGVEQWLVLLTPPER